MRIIRYIIRVFRYPGSTDEEIVPFCVVLLILLMGAGWYMGQPSFQISQRADAIKRSRDFAIKTAIKAGIKPGSLVCYKVSRFSGPICEKLK